MKRLFAISFHEPEALVTKHKYGEKKPGRIFSISRIERQNVSNSIMEQKSINPSYDTSNNPILTSSKESKEVRVGVSSRVNFCKLTLAEQRERFVNQGQEIRRLKMKFRKYRKSTKSCKNVLLQKALEKIRKVKHDLEDQRHLLENLSAAIISGRLGSNSLGFSQISTIIRDLLGLDSPESRYFIDLPEKTIPISSIEYENYKKLPCTSAILRKILGREQKTTDDPKELLNSLSIFNYHRIKDYNSLNHHSKNGHS